MSAKELTIFKGLLLALLSGIFYSIVSVIVKDMKHMHPGQLALYRFIAIFVTSFPQTVQTGQNPFGPKKYRFFLYLRGIFGGINFFTNFMALQYLSLSVATAIIFSCPILVTVFARILLKEPCNFLQSITVVLTFVGIIFMTKLPSRLTKVPVVYTNEIIWGLLAALCSVTFMSFQILLARKMKSVHEAIMNFNYGLMTIVETAFLTLIFGKFSWHHCSTDGLYIIILGLCSYAGQTIFILALKCEFAGPVTTMKAAADIVLAYLWQIYVFHEDTDIYSIIGSVLVGLSIVLLGFNKCSNKSENYQEIEGTDKNN